ncbi:glucose dehydrogenase [FAD, quinone]-like [Nilaparvata lugens]|uniref:glucose dehydrogenase [FAD, quinone]-like n=1 Tax=Nilaparvata lugens TaxID=108931 RepID=UPI00193C9D43|nr:glucose dehydrogenase [FAD, quinone]-like [Nilaparvata lugens]
MAMAKLEFSMMMMVMTAVLIPAVLAQSTSFPPLFEGIFTWIKDGLNHHYSEPKDIGLPKSEYDFIIVGAGSAGCVLANRLTEVEDWSVLLIEAGKEENFLMDIPVLVNFLQFTEANWKYRTVPSNDACLGMKERRCNIPRGKVMGGSSVLNYMIFTRGHRKDYDIWERMGNEGWGYKDVLPYFIKSERVEFPNADFDYRGSSGPQSVSQIPYRSPIGRAFVQAGVKMGFKEIDPNGERQQGFHYIQASMHNGTRMSTSRAYLHPIKSRKNLHVLKRSHVTRLLIRSGSNVVYGVEYLRNGKRYTVTAKKEVILSAGAVNTPQILMLSGIGPRDELNKLGVPLVKALPVGYNLMDHVALGGFEVNVNAKNIKVPNTDRILNSPQDMYDFAEFRTGPVASPGGIEAIAFVDLSNPTNPDGHPDLELMLSFGSLHSEPTLQDNFGINDRIYNEAYRYRSEAFSIYPMILRPKSRGRVWLKNKNPRSKPLIDMGYFSNPVDIEILTKGINFTKSLLKQTPFKALKPSLAFSKSQIPGCKQHRADSDAYWECHARHLPFTIYHQSGTCKMGKSSDQSTVVDARLKVHGMRNLRVVDASIFPEIPASHPNGVVIMIAEKASDMIKQDHGVNIM